MGQSLGDLHYTLGIDDRELDKQLAAAKEKIKAALAGVGGVGGDTKAAKIALDIEAKKAIVNQRVEATNVSVARSEAVKSGAINKTNLSIQQSIVLEAKKASIEASTANSGALNAQKILNLEAQKLRTIESTRIATERAANAQKRMAEQATFANKTFLSQGVIASQLATILGTTFSVYAVGAFVKKLAEVRGEFELQSVALRAITRDKEAADKIFSQVKALSVQSPFTFSELLRDTKQLAAFSVETDKLFGTLTRLADVSAGLGVDMNRIILAYGQVRAATVLRGQELRQFTEAGIPIIDMLANKFTKLEGTVVSAGDVFKRISEKMVSFKDVDEIFTQLTSSGGMFFEMQKKQADTLSGKLSNLKDAYMIMLNSIGEGSEGTLKGGVDFLTNMMRNWEKIADVLKIVIAAYGTYKAVVLITSAAESANTAIRVASIGVMRANIAANITMSSSQVALAASTKLVSGAFVTLGAAIKSNWIGLTITALVGLGIALNNAYQKANELKNALGKIYSEEKGTADAQIFQIELLTKKLKDANLESVKRKQIIDQLNTIAGPYLKNLITEGMSYDEITRALGGVTDAIYENAKAKAYSASTTKITEKLAVEIADAEKGIRGVLEKGLLLRPEVATEIISRMVGDIKNNPKLASDIEGLTKYINTTIKDVTGRRGDVGLGFIGGLTTGVQQYSDALSEVKIESDKATESISAMNGVNSNTEVLIKKIRDATAADVEAIRDSAGGMFKEIEVRDRKIKGLLEEAEAYRILEQFSKEAGARSAARDLNPLIDDLGRLKMATGGLQEFKDSKLALAALFPENKDWETVANDIIAKVKETEEAYKAYLVVKKSDDPAQNIQDAVKLDSLRKISVAYRTIAEQLLGWREKEKDAAGKKPKYLTDIEREIELMKEAKKAYEEYQKVMSNSEALAKVRIQFPMIEFEEKGILARLDMLFKKTQKDSSKYADETRIAVKKYTNEVLKEGVIDTFEKFAKDIQEYFDKNKEKFDLYKTILDITGKKDFAMEVSFGVDFKDKDIKEILRAQIEKIVQWATEIKLPKDLTGLLFKDVFNVKELEFSLTPEVVKQLESAFNTIKAYEQSENIDRLKRMVEYRKAFGSNEEKKLAIFEEYQRKLDFVEKDGSIQSASEKIKVIQNIKNERNIAMAEVDAVILASTKMYKDLYSDMEFYSVGRIKRIVNETRSVLTDAVSKQPNDKGVVNVVIDGKNVELTQKQIESLLKKIEEVDASLAKSDPFLKIAEGFKLISKGGDGADKGFSMVISGLKDTIGMLSPLADALGNLGEATENTGMQKFASDMKDVIEYSQLALDVVSAIASGKPGEIVKSLLAVVVKLINAEAEYQAAKRKSLLENIKMQYEYNNLLMAEKLLFLSGVSIFGVDELGKVTNAMVQYRDIANQMKETAKGLMDASIKTGEAAKTYGFFGANITYGHYTTYGKLSDQYKGLYEDGKLNTNMAKTLVASDKLTESTKQQIEQLIKLDEQAKQAYDQMTQYLTNVFGGLGRALSDSIVTAFRDGKDASLDFKNNVTSTIEKLTQDLMNSLFLADYFNKFQTKIEKIYTDPKLSKEDTGKQTLNVMGDFLDGLSVQAAMGTEFLATMQAEAKKRGIDLFQPTAATAGAKATLGGEIKAVTEDTAQLLGSLLNAVRGDVSNQLIHVKAIEGILSITGSTTSASLAELVKIQDNTFQVMVLLKSVIGSKVDTGTGLRVYTW